MSMDWITKLSEQGVNQNQSHSDRPSIVELTPACSALAAMSSMSNLGTLEFRKQLFQLCYVVKGLRWNQV